MTTSEFLQDNTFSRVWLPENTVNGMIALVHGLGEHSGRYAHLAASFTSAGYGIVAIDTWGHGLTPGIRGHAPSMESYLDQVDLLLAKAEEIAPGKAVFLYGHSMGGCLVLNHLFRRNPRIAGLIATSPAIRPGFKPGRLLLFIGRIGRALAPSFTQPNSLNLNNLSHDPEVIRMYKSDPLVHNKVSGVVGLGIIEWGEWLLQNITDTRVPILLMHGTEDQLTSWEASRTFAGKLKGDVTFKSWEGLFHELHNEFQKDEIMEFTKKWVTKNTNG